MDCASDRAGRRVGPAVSFPPRATRYRFPPLSATADLRIAIVGAGPSGLSLAWYLARLGCRAVEIFEASDDVGGQSHTVIVDGIPVELGTCYMADGYVIAREIARTVGTPVDRLPPATFLDANGRIVKPAMPSIGSMGRYVVEWFRWYFGGQLANPTKAEYTVAYDAWLKQVGLNELAESTVFADGCTAQLYGPLDAVTANNGLSWVRPSLLITGRFEHTAYVPDGYQTMWKRVVRHLGYPVHFGEAVQEVRPVEEGGATQVEVIRGGKPFERRFDHVIVACPLDETAAHAGTALTHPLSRMLKEDFAPFDATEVYSAVWRASHWPLGAPSRCYLPACGTGERGRLLTIRQYGRTGEDWVGQLCAYAIDDKVPMHYEERLKANRAAIVRDMEQIVGLKEVRILDDKLWRYAVRYSPQQFQQGLPAAIAARQGTGHVWYTTGQFAHWDVDMIANFNQALAWEFGGAAGLSLLDRLRIYRLRDLIKDL